MGALAQWRNHSPAHTGAQWRTAKKKNPYSEGLGLNAIY